jgi:nitrate/TMAO reductase-like tetraheme cytochrome c subunit
VAKNEKKVRVISDMLRFEREQMTSNEKEWKNTKKLLVKEVKSCRSHIVTLEAELEGLRRQNEQLKQGLRVMSPPNKGLKYR